MSIIESLVRLVDPIQARQREQERRTAREQPKRDNDGGEPPRFTCRVCGHIGDDKSYCPECLADTMEATPAR